MIGFIDLIAFLLLFEKVEGALRFRKKHQARCRGVQPMN